MKKRSVVQRSLKKSLFPLYAKRIHNALCSIETTFGRSKMTSRSKSFEPNRKSWETHADLFKHWERLQRNCSMSSKDAIFACDEDLLREEDNEEDFKLITGIGRRWDESVKNALLQCPVKVRQLQGNSLCNDQWSLELGLCSDFVTDSLYHSTK